MAAVALKALGEFALTYDGRALPAPVTRKARALVAYLVMHRSSDIAREHLLEVFWKDFDPQRGRDNLNATLWSIRRIFRNARLDPDTLIRADRTTLRWQAPVDFDVDRLLALGERRSEDAAAEALSLYCGDFLEGDFDDWSVAERERISLVYEKVLSHAAKGFRNTAAAEQLIGRNPYDEAAYATLIESQIQDGQPLAAAVLVERCRRALEEVGAKPSATFEEQYGHLRRPGDPPSELRVPFVARGGELALLFDRFSKCASGKGSVTLVHGDAGIGKSTLLAHASRAAPEYVSRVVKVQCDRDDRGDLVRALEAVASSREPCVVVIDDVQNVTADAFLLLTTLVLAESGRQCFVVAVRPEGLGKLRRALDRCAASEIALTPLSRADVELAVREATGVELSDVSSKLFDRTQGHPLYVVRLLEALVEGGALERHQRTWRVTKKFDSSLPLPGSVRSFIETRLLSRGKAAASVAGALAIEPFATAADLSGVLALSEEKLLDALDDLLALGLVYQPHSGPQFEFAHDLIREVAAARLNAGRAVRIHRQFAELLQLSADRNATGRIAAHLLAAGDLLDAGRAFARVAQNAFDDATLLDSIQACERGASALRQLEVSDARDALLAAIFQTESRAQFALGDASSAVQAAGRAVDLERSRRSASLGLAVVNRARCNKWLGHLDLASSDLEEALVLARHSEDSRLLAASMAELSEIALTHAEKGAALSLARQAYETAIAVNDWPCAHAAVRTLVTCFCAFGEPDDAVGLTTPSLELAQRCSDGQQADHLNIVALVSYAQHRYAEAEGALSAARAIDCPMLPPALFFNRLLSGMVALAQARWEDALATAEILEARADPNILRSQFVAASALRIEALLSRNMVEDLQHAHVALASMPSGTLPIFPWNVPEVITRAGVEARSRPASAVTILRCALDAAEERAQEMPFDAERSYAQIERACKACGCSDLATRAALRREYYSLTKSLSSVAMARASS